MNAVFHITSGIAFLFLGYLLVRKTAQLRRVQSYLRATLGHSGPSSLRVATLEDFLQGFCDDVGLAFDMDDKVRTTDLRRIHVDGVLAALLAVRPQAVTLRSVRQAETTQIVLKTHGHKGNLHDILHSLEQALGGQVSAVVEPAER